MVKLHHQVLLPTLARIVGEVAFTCGEATADAGRVVRLSWFWEGRSRAATYAVGPSGQVAPFDANAARIDGAAKGISVGALIILLRALA